MEDARFKYLALHKGFPDRAGKLDQVAATLKRAIRNYPKHKLSDNAKAILLTASELVDVCEEYNKFMKSLLNQVFVDYSNLSKVAEMQSILDEQAELLKLFLDQDTKPNDIPRTNSRTTQD